MSQPIHWKAGKRTKNQGLSFKNLITFLNKDNNKALYEFKRVGVSKGCNKRKTNEPNIKNNKPVHYVFVFREKPNLRPLFYHQVSEKEHHSSHQNYNCVASKILKILPEYTTSKDLPKGFTQPTDIPFEEIDWEEDVKSFFPSIVRENSFFSPVRVEPPVNCPYLQAKLKLQEDVRVSQEEANERVRQNKNVKHYILQSRERISAELLGVKTPSCHTTEIKGELSDSAVAELVTIHNKHLNAKTIFVCVYCEKSFIAVNPFHSHLWEEVQRREDIHHSTVCGPKGCEPRCKRAYQYNYFKHEWIDTFMLRHRKPFATKFEGDRLKCGMCEKLHVSLGWFHQKYSSFEELASHAFYHSAALSIECLLCADKAQNGKTVRLPNDTKLLGLHFKKEHSTVPGITEAFRTWVYESELTRAMKTIIKDNCIDFGSTLIERIVRREILIEGESQEPKRDPKRIIGDELRVLIKDLENSASEVHELLDFEGLNFEESVEEPVEPQNSILNDLVEKCGIPRLPPEKGKEILKKILSVDNRTIVLSDSPFRAEADTVYVNDESFEVCERASIRHRKGHLTGKTMVTFLHILLEKLTTYDVVVIEAEWMKRIENDDFEYPTRFTEETVIFFIINVELSPGVSHWYGAIGSCSQHKRRLTRGKLMVFDPLPSSDGPEALGSSSSGRESLTTNGGNKKIYLTSKQMITIRKIKLFLEKSTDFKKDTKPEQRAFSYRKEKFIKQFDKHSCGVLVLAFFESVINPNKSFERFSQQSLGTYRNYIADVIENYYNAEPLKVLLNSTQNYI